MKTSHFLCLSAGLLLSFAAAALDQESHPIVTLANLDDGVRLTAGAMATRVGTDSGFDCDAGISCEVGGIAAENAGSDRLAGAADFEGYVPYIGMEFGSEAEHGDAALTRIGVAFTSSADSDGCMGRCDSAPELMHKDFDTALTGASLRPMVRLDWAFRF